MYSFSPSEYPPELRAPGPKSVDMPMFRGITLKNPVMPNYEALTELEAYRRTENQRHRDRIVYGNIKAILKVSHTIYRHHQYAEIEDIVQAGITGFIGGLDKFEFRGDPLPSPKKIRKGNYVMVFGGQKVASYALNYSKKEIYRYLSEDVPNVRIGRRAVASAHKAMRQLEVASREYETSMPIDVLLAHKGPAERIGALDVYSSNPSYGSEYFEQGRVGTPADTPSEEFHDQRFAQVLCHLQGTDRALVLAFYQNDGQRSFTLACDQHGYSLAEGRSKVRKAVAMVKERLVPGCP